MLTLFSCNVHIPSVDASFKKKNLNSISNVMKKETDIPFIRLTFQNSVFKCIGFHQTFCNNWEYHVLHL